MEDSEGLDLGDWIDPDADKFAVRVYGDAMIDDHIADGDFVVIKRQDRAIDGEVIAFRADDGEITLRRIYREPAGVRLRASNPDVADIRRDKVAILGVLVGVVRKY